MRRALPLVAALAGCMGADPDTLVSELRVVGLQAEPAAYQPAVGTTLTATVYRADQQATELLLWTCTPGPLGCFEAGIDGFEQPLSAWTTLATPTDDTAAHVVSANPIVATVFADEAPPMLAWALACAPGVCPILDEVRADPTPGSAAWAAAVAWLADPFEGLKDVSKQGSAASFRPLQILLEGDPPANPVVQLVDPVGELTVASGEQLTLRFSVVADGEVIAYPLATAGGFDARERPVVDGSVSLDVVAGVPDSEEAPPVPAGTVISAFVGFEAADGGSALWTGTITVR